MGMFTFGSRILFLLILLAAGIFWYANGLQEVSLETFELTGISSIDMNAFTLTGDFFVKNPSKVSVPVKEIRYDVLLKSNGNQIGEGTMDGFTLKKQAITQIPFEQEIRWTPTFSLAAELLTKEEVFVVVQGTLFFEVQGNTFGIDFSDEQDIKRYIKEQSNSLIS